MPPEREVFMLVSRKEGDEEVVTSYNGPTVIKLPCLERLGGRGAVIADEATRVEDPAVTPWLTEAFANGPELHDCIRRDIPGIDELLALDNDAASSRTV